MTALLRNALPLCLGICLVAVGSAQEAPMPEPAREDPVHEELRTLRDGMIDAVGENDLDALLAYMHPDVVVTWINGEQSRGHDAVREYYERMTTGDERIVESFSINDVDVKELTLLYGGDTGVSYGTATSNFVLTDGRDLSITGPWSATTVREDDRWLITSFHASANMFDNPVLDLVVQWTTRVGLGAGLAGLVAGFVIALLLKKRRSASSGGDAV